MFLSTRIAYWETDLMCSSLPLDLFNPPLLGRAGFEQKVIDKNPLVVNDDVVSLLHKKISKIVAKYTPFTTDDAKSAILQISFNTQGSSQWDSLRHFAFQKEQKFYNG